VEGEERLAQPTEEGDAGSFVRSISLMGVRIRIFITY